MVKTFQMRHMLNENIYPSLVLSSLCFHPIVVFKYVITICILCVISICGNYFSSWVSYASHISAVLYLYFWLQVVSRASCVLSAQTTSCLERKRSARKPQPIPPNIWVWQTVNDLWRSWLRDVMYLKPTCYVWQGKRPNVAYYYLTTVKTNKASPLQRPSIKT